MIRTLSLACFLVTLVALPSTALLAQDTGGGTTGGESSANTGGGGSGGAPGAQGDINDNLSLDTSIPEIAIPEFEDNRNQGFVGATSANVVEFGFVGGLSGFAGGSSEGSFGGDANVTASTGGGGGRGGNAGFAGGGTANGFQVVRPKFIRTRLRVNFEAPTVPNEFLSDRLNIRLNRLPGAAGRQGVNVTVTERVATLTGSTESREAAARLERQLRLEPGISRVVNQLTYPSQ